MGGGGGQEYREAWFKHYLFVSNEPFLKISYAYKYTV